MLDLADFTKQRIPELITPGFFYLILQELK